MLTLALIWGLLRHRLGHAVSSVDDSVLGLSIYPELQCLGLLCGCDSLSRANTSDASADLGGDGWSVCKRSCMKHCGKISFINLAGQTLSVRPFRPLLLSSPCGRIL